MANRITSIERTIPTEQQQQTESLTELLKALSDNRQAIVAFLDILNDMNESGVLDIVRGALKSRAALGSIGMDFINVANIPNMLKNVIMASQFLGRLDPSQTQMLISGLDNGLKQAMQNGEEPKNLFGMLGLMRDPNVKTTLSTGLHFLRGMGEGLNKREETTGKY